jgi:tetraacyldisaccharide 4'-kinase
MNRRWMLPLVPLYAAGLAWRNRRIESGSEPVRRLRWPLVSIGNLSTGGSGKTPLTIALAKALSARGLAVEVLSRGYGRKSRLVARVDPNGTAEEFGDEPLLIAREGRVPVYVAAQRYDAGRLAEADSSAVLGDGVHLLDDGFQHRQLARDADIVLLNGEDWQDRLLPAGNLREPLTAIRRATVLAIPADELEFEAELRTWGWRGSIWRLKRTMDVPRVVGPVMAFCGIARPEQFFAGLESAGMRIAARRTFPDHHRYTHADVERLTASALDAGASALMTTGKDAARLGERAFSSKESLPLKTAGLRIEIEDEGAALDWLIGLIAAVRPRPAL